MNTSVVSRVASVCARLAVVGAALLVCQRTFAATTIINENFNDRTLGPIANATSGGIGDTNDDGNIFWAWNGPDSGNVTHTWSFVSDPGGGKALEIQVDGANAVGTDWWWGLGIGKSGIFPAPGTSNINDIQVSLSSQIINPETNYTAPNNKYLNIHIEQFDPTLQPDPTNHPEVVGWPNFVADFKPQIVDGAWHNYLTTLNGPDVTRPTSQNYDPDTDPNNGNSFPLPIASVMDPNRQFTLRFDWNNWNNASSMGLDDGNILRLDDINITNTAAALANDGDYDDNGIINAADIDILWHMVRGTATDPGSNDTADLDGSGLVNEDDVDLMMALVPAGPHKYGDADIDGDVDGADFDAWRLRSGYTGAGTGKWAIGDFDGDGDVDGGDFDLWRLRPSTYPTSVGAHGGGGSLVPEPATFVLMGLALPALGLIARRRK